VVEGWHAGAAIANFMYVDPETTQGCQTCRSGMLKVERLRASDCDIIIKFNARYGANLDMRPEENPTAFCQNGLSGVLERFWISYRTT